MTKSMNDLSKQQYDRVSNEEYDSEESGYVASQIGGSYQEHWSKEKTSNVNIVIISDIGVLDLKSSSFFSLTQNPITT